MKNLNNRSIKLVFFTNFYSLDPFNASFDSSVNRESYSLNEKLITDYCSDFVIVRLGKRTGNYVSDVELLLSEYEEMVPAVLGQIKKGKQRREVKYIFGDSPALTVNDGFKREFYFSTLGLETRKVLMPLGYAATFSGLGLFCLTWGLRKVMRSRK